MCREFWQPLMDFFRTRLLAEGTIAAEDAERIILTDSADEAVACVTEIGMRRFGLTYGPLARRRWFLGE